MAGYINSLGAVLNGPELNGSSGVDVAATVGEDAFALDVVPVSQSAPVTEAGTAADSPFGIAVMAMPIVESAPVGHSDEGYITYKDSYYAGQSGALNFTGANWTPIDGWGVFRSFEAASEVAGAFDTLSPTATLVSSVSEVSSAQEALSADVPRSASVAEAISITESGEGYVTRADAYYAARSGAVNATYVDFGTINGYGLVRVSTSTEEFGYVTESAVVVQVHVAAVLEAQSATDTVSGQQNGLILVDISETASLVAGAIDQNQMQETAVVVDFATVFMHVRGHPPEESSVEHTWAANPLQHADKADIIAHSGGADPSPHSKTAGSRNRSGGRVSEVKRGAAVMANTTSLRVSNHTDGSADTQHVATGSVERHAA